MSARLYAFKLSSAEIDPVLYIERGLRCGGEQLGCSRGSRGVGRAQVTRYVAAGESVTLIADSAAGEGTFTLDIEKLSTTACGGATYAPLSDPPITRTLAPSDPSMMTASCLPTLVSAQPGGVYELADHSYHVSVPAGYACSIRVEATGPVALYVLEGSECRDAEHLCVEAREAPYYLDESIGQFQSSIGSEWVAVVESAFPISGSIDYTLSGSCVAP